MCSIIPLYENHYLVISRQAIKKSIAIPKAQPMLRKYAFPSHNTNKNGGVYFGSFVLHVNYSLSVKEKATVKLYCNRKMGKGELCSCKTLPVCFLQSFEPADLLFLRTNGPKGLQYYKCSLRVYTSSF